MPISKSKDLFFLIKSLTKAEKRAFRIYASRFQEGEGLLYLQLFDLFEKQKVLNDKEVMVKMDGLNASRYSNLKRHLFGQILNALRLIEKEKKTNIKIREQIDFAYVLYGKGLYLLALKILEKAKFKAEKHGADFSLLTIIEMEKMIQERHITRSGPEYASKLVESSEEIIERINNRVELSNVRMNLHSIYIAKGHAKNKEEAEGLKEQFFEKLTRIEAQEEILGIMEKVFLYQSFVWYFYILFDFEQCYTYALKWVGLFEDNKAFQSRDVNIFFRGYHHLLNSSFILKERVRLESHLAELEHFRKSNYAKFNENTKVLSFLHVHNARYNEVFLQGDFEKGLDHIRRTNLRLKRYQDKLDIHKVMIFHYKIAWMYFGNHQLKNCLLQLEKVLFSESNSLRVDIQIYSRLLYLMALYETEDFNRVLSKIQSFKAFFEKQEEKNDFQNTVIDLFQNLATAALFDRKEVFVHFREKLIDLKEDPYHGKGFLYLEILPWIETKITKKSLRDVINKGFDVPWKLL